MSDRRLCKCGQAFEVRTDDSRIPGSIEVRLVGGDQALWHCPRCDRDLPEALREGQLDVVAMTQ